MRHSRLALLIVASGRGVGRAPRGGSDAAVIADSAPHLDGNRHLGEFATPPPTPRLYKVIPGTLQISMFVPFVCGRVCEQMTDIAIDSGGGMISSHSARSTRSIRPTRTPRCCRNSLSGAFNDCRTCPRIISS